MAPKVAIRRLGAGRVPATTRCYVATQISGPKDPEPYGLIQVFDPALRSRPSSLSGHRSLFTDSGGGNGVGVANRCQIRRDSRPSALGAGGMESLPVAADSYPRSPKQNRASLVIPRRVCLSWELIRGG